MQYFASRAKAEREHYLMRTSLRLELWPKDKLHCSAIWGLKKSKPESESNTESIPENTRPESSKARSDNLATLSEGRSCIYNMH